MLDFIGTVVTVAIMMVAFNGVITFMDISRGAKLTLAVFIGLWIGLAAAAGAAGFIAISRPFPMIGPFFAAPLLAAVIASFSPSARAAMLGLPLRLMIGLNIGRVFAVLFLLLETEGRLAGPFPFFAAWGDIITGAGALLLLLIARRDDALPTGVTTVWNLFGIADLVSAISLGVMSAEGSPLQVFTTSPGSAAMQQLPWSFVPTVLVPFWLILHAIIWVKLRQRRIQ